jgi:hypothetical protein
MPDGWGRVINLMIKWGSYGDRAFPKEGYGDENGVLINGEILPEKIPSKSDCSGLNFNRDHDRDRKFWSRIR